MCYEISQSIHLPVKVLYMSMESEIQNVLKVLASGGTVLYPTNTIWGIGCDATNTSAVDKIFNIKKRGAEKSLIILLDDAAKLSNYIEHVPKEALSLIETTRSEEHTSELQ